MKKLWWLPVTIAVVVAILWLTGLGDGTSLVK